MKKLEDLRAVEFKLSETINNVAVKGDIVDIDTVTLYAPTGANRKQISIMQSFIGPLFKKITSNVTDEQVERAREILEERKEKKQDEQSTSEDDEGFTGKEFAHNANVIGFDSDKFDRALDAFKDLLVKGKRGTLGGAPITETLFDDFEWHDLENMFYQYGVSFLLDSLIN